MYESLSRIIMWLFWNIVRRRIVRHIQWVSSNLFISSISSKGSKMAFGRKFWWFSDFWWYSSMIIVLNIQTDSTGGRSGGNLCIIIHLSVLTHLKKILPIKIQYVYFLLGFLMINWCFCFLVASTLTLRGSSYVSYRVYDWKDRVHSSVNRISLQFKVIFLYRVVN